MPTQKQIDAAKALLAAAGETAAPSVRIYADISSEANARLQAYADAQKISKKAALEALINKVK